jgi:hypothetical protein
VKAEILENRDDLRVEVFQRAERRADGEHNTLALVGRQRCADLLGMFHPSLLSVARRWACQSSPSPGSVLDACGNATGDATKPRQVYGASGLGEQIANQISCLAVPVRSCRVSFTGPSGVRHSVEVTAESLYEAAGLGLNVLSKEGWADQIAPGTELQVEVREPATTHTVTVAQLRRWCDGVAVSPDEVLKRKRVKAMLALQSKR